MMAKRPSMGAARMAVTRGWLLAGAALGAVYAAPVHAQTSSPAPATTHLDEIVVTAQRREQRLQDVGIAVTALNSKSIAALGLKDSTDLTRAASSPGENGLTR